jgi:hypothetical protein
MKSKKILIITCITFLSIILGAIFVGRSTLLKKDLKPAFEENTVPLDEGSSSEVVTDLASGENPLEFVSVPGPDADDPVGTEVFIGQLQALDTGCFADGECFVIVDGKKITTMLGGRGVSQENLGSVKGLDSFIALFDYIGTFVEVKALKQDDGNYTLYGSKDFYIKLF